MQHFGIAKEYEKNPETISITYYCMMFVANEALKLQKEKQFVSSVIDYLETVNFQWKGEEIDGKVYSRRNEIIRMMKLFDRCQQVKQLLKN